MKATAKNIANVLETINSIKNEDNMFSTDVLSEKYGEGVWEVLDELENNGSIEFTEDIDAEFDGIVK